MDSPQHMSWPSLLKSVRRNDDDDNSFKRILSVICPHNHIASLTPFPVMVVYFTYMEDYAGKNQYPLLFALCVASLLIASTFFGRVYYGVHTFIDTIGGFMLALLIFAAYIRFVFDGEWSDDNDGNNGNDHDEEVEAEKDADTDDRHSQLLSEWPRSMLSIFIFIAHHFTIDVAHNPS